MKSILLTISMFCVISNANTELADTIITDSGKVVNSYLVSIDGTKEKISSITYKNELEWVKLIITSDTITFFTFDSMITFHSKDCISKRIYRATNSTSIYSFEQRDEYKSIHTVNLNHKTQMLDNYTSLERIVGKTIITSYNRHLVDFETKFNSNVGADVVYNIHTRRIFDDRIIEQYYMDDANMATIVIYTKPVSETKEQKIKFKVRDDGSIDG